MEKFPHDVQLEHVNLVLELFITLNEHEEALELLCKRCGAKFESDLSGSEISQMNHEEQLKVFKKVNLPPNTPVDIHAKLIVVLLNLQASHLAWPLAQPLVGLQVIFEYSEKKKSPSVHEITQQVRILFSRCTQFCAAF